MVVPIPPWSGVSTIDAEVDAEDEEPDEDLVRLALDEDEALVEFLRRGGILRWSARANRLPVVKRGENEGIRYF